MVTSHSTENAPLTDAETKMLQTAGYIADHKSVSHMSTSKILLSACDAHKMYINPTRLLLLSNYFDTGII